MHGYAFVVAAVFVVASWLYW